MDEYIVLINYPNDFNELLYLFFDKSDYKKSASSYYQVFVKITNKNFTMIKGEPENYISFDEWKLIYTLEDNEHKDTKPQGL